MSRAHTHRLSWLLLVLLALRGLVPTGYMIEASAQGLAIVVCDSGIYQAALGAHAKHHHHGDGPQTQHDHSICPFALAAAGFSPPVVQSTVDVAGVVIDRVHDVRTATAFVHGPPRAQQSRAPPYFS